MASTRSVEWITRKVATADSILRRLTNKSEHSNHVSTHRLYLAVTGHWL